MKDWRTQALAHAEAVYPAEACGVVVEIDGVPAFWPCRNIDTQPGDRFELHPDDYAAAEDAGEVTGIVHSHPNASALPSAADRVMCERRGLPWYIVGVPSGVWSGCQPSGYALPLLRRPFVHGVIDCYTLVRDAMQSLFGVALPDFERADDWWQHGGDLYRQHAQDAGYAALPADAPLWPGDLITMQIHANVPNHGAVYLGDGVMLHHLCNRLSARETYGGYWLHHTASRYRHGEITARPDPVRL